MRAIRHLTLALSVLAALAVCAPVNAAPATAQPASGPTISITSPSNGATVSAAITVTGTDTVAIGRPTVQGQIDTGAWQPLPGTESWGFPINTAALSNAQHTITVKVTDGAGASATASVTVTVANSVVYTPPGSIPSDCSTAADAQIQGWLATVPDHSVIQLPAGACYGQTSTIEIFDRTGLVIDGNGATFKYLILTDTRDRGINVFVQGGADLIFTDVTIIGQNPATGFSDNSYVVNGHIYAWQYGIYFGATHGVLVDNVSIERTLGDFIGFSEDKRYGFPGHGPVTNAVVANSDFYMAGRQGISPTNIDGLVVRQSSFSIVDWAAIDIELDHVTSYGRAIQIVGNTFDMIRLATVANLGGGQWPNVGDITIANNHMTGTLTIGVQTCEPPIHVEAPPGYQRQYYEVSNNQFIAFGTVMTLVRVTNAVVTGTNLSQKVNGGCADNTGVKLVDAHTIAITDNAFTGEASVYIADSSTTDVTSSGNTI